MNRWDLFALAIPILGLAPLLYVEAYQVWQWRHMQFAPLMLVIAAVTCFRHRGSALAGDWRRVWFAIGVWVAASLVGVAAMFWYSPWLAHCAAIMVFGGWALGRFGEVTWSKVAAWTAMLVITAPLPLNMDQMLIQKLQLTSSIACSSALDGLQVSHLRAGNVLSVRGQDLLLRRRVAGSVVFTRWPRSPLYFWH